jgi:hypothetical protein
MKGKRATSCAANPFWMTKPILLNTKLQFTFDTFDFVAPEIVNLLKIVQKVVEKGNMLLFIYFLSKKFIASQSI